MKNSIGVGDKVKCLDCGEIIELNAETFVFDPDGEYVICPHCGEGYDVCAYLVGGEKIAGNKCDSENKQEAKADAGKVRLTLVPRKIIWAIGRIREYGNKKYGDSENWRRVEKERYRDAAYRHFMAYLDDPAGKDEESGLPHLWHLATNVAFLCEMEDFEAKPQKTKKRMIEDYLQEIIDSYCDCSNTEMATMAATAKHIVDGLE
jgi:ribosomal protein S27E